MIHSCGKITLSLSRIPAVFREWMQNLEQMKQKLKGNKFDCKSVWSLTKYDPRSPAVLLSVAEYLNLWMLVKVIAEQQLMLEFWWCKEWPPSFGFRTEVQYSADINIFEQICLKITQHFVSALCRPSTHSLYYLLHMICKNLGKR